MRGPEFADDLFRRDPLALGNLLAASADRGLETCPILGIELFAVVILRYELEANLGAFREIDDILDDNATALNATVQQRHTSEDTTTARDEHDLRLPSAQEPRRVHIFVQLARAIPLAATRSGLLPLPPPHRSARPGTPKIPPLREVLS